MDFKTIMNTQLRQYKKYHADADLIRKWLETFCDTSKEKELALLEMKITVIDCWLQLLNADEQFVVRHRIIDGMEWAQVEKAFSEKWGEGSARSVRTLMCYQAEALQKMEHFFDEHFEEIMTVFQEDVLQRNTQNKQ